MPSKSTATTLLRDNGLVVVLIALFLISEFGHAAAGWQVDATERLQQGRTALSLAAYLCSGAYLSSLFENWESEFLQMWAYVMLTAYLVQRGSPESKDPDKAAPQDRDPALDTGKADAPSPVRAGALARRLYSHSLGIALLALFVASFILHWINSARAANEAAAQHGEPAQGLLSYLGSSQLWFESFQNWQSEFLSTAALIVLAIFLRERGSPESKAVGEPHSKTGTD